MKLSLHFRLGTRGNDLEERDELAVDFADPIAQPHAHVTDHLLVAAAARVQLTRDVLADDLAQAALVGRMNLVHRVSREKSSRMEWPLTSSSFGMMTKVSCFHSSITWSRPRSMAWNSSWLMMPTLELALANAIDPRMSSLYRALSNRIEALYLCIRGSIAPTHREVIILVSEACFRGHWHL